MVQAQPPLEFLPPNLQPWVLRSSQWGVPFWLRWQVGIPQVEAENMSTLVECFQQFQQGKIRFLLAFRHPSPRDPIALFYLLSHWIPQAARQQGVKLRLPIHAHFLYDRGVPLWFGSTATWLFPRLGATSIQRGKLDRLGLRSARDLFLNGQFPMAAAPEGFTNGHNELVSPLEPGVAQMGFWCKEDLVKAGRSENVVILPIGIKYGYIHDPWPAVEKLLSRLEQESGSVTNLALTPYERLFHLGEHYLTLMEQFYRRYYPRFFPPPAPDLTTDPNPSTDPNQLLAARLQTLLDGALKVAENYFGIEPNGSLIDRCRRIEQAGWDRIYREDLKEAESLTAIERGLADRIAEEADQRMWHMRLAESFVSVTGRYVQDKQTPERFAESLLLLHDVSQRIRGDTYPSYQRPSLGAQRVSFTIGHPLSIDDRWDAYAQNRRNARQEVADLTQALQTALEAML